LRISRLLYTYGFLVCDAVYFGYYVLSYAINLLAQSYKLNERLIRFP